MADNVPITAGSGTSIATDDAGAGGHVQLMKLSISTDGSATMIPADATNGLDVDVTRIQGVSSATVTSVTAAAADTAILASNSARKAMYVYNDSSQTLYLKYGTGASLTSYTTQVPSQQLWEMPEMPVYTGAVNGYWTQAQGSARVTEL